MPHLFRLFGYFFLTIWIVSCATIEEQTKPESSIDDIGNYRYAAWRLDGSGEFEAINVLLDEADLLIEDQAYNAAADKLERALRIKPEYAPAWSRLS